MGGKKEFVRRFPAKSHFLSLRAEDWRTRAELITFQKYTPRDDGIPDAVIATQDTPTADLVEGTSAGSGLSRPPRLIKPLTNP